VPRLQALKRGGVYLGVAPDQNFTYMAAVEPKMAFIMDIRRGNLHAHLMYKALFELSADRAEFVSRLFTKKRPDGLGAESSASDIMNAYWDVPTEPAAAYQANLKAITDQLTKKHGWALTEDDIKGIEYVYYSFYWFGPSITYSSSTSSNARPGNMPTYADLMRAADQQGQAQGYLANERNFKFVKTLEEKNMIVPIVGDFSGPKALRCVAKYLTDRAATVAAFYVSNVEQYLFQNRVWPGFYQNLAMFPIDDQSVIIRSASGRNVLDPIRMLLRDFVDGKINSYPDITSRGTF
jgi:hypothetical protein